uniref:protein-tyrosine-phosphatase n=1 Tax=Hippocampus comes TaxID=109280 RepID=A0A3Q3DCH5_HIPCM
MIWQQNIGIIVMITNLKEKGRVRALVSPFWAFLILSKTLKPQIRFTLIYSHLRFPNVQRPPTSLILQAAQRKAEHTVQQYHYTQWPDMGVPEYTLPVLSFIRTSSRARTQDMGPVLVHCR